MGALAPSGGGRAVSRPAKATPTFPHISHLRVASQGRVHSRSHLRFASCPERARLTITCWAMKHTTQKLYYFYGCGPTPQHFSIPKTIVLFVSADWSRVVQDRCQIGAPAPSGGERVVSRRARATPTSPPDTPCGVAFVSYQRGCIFSPAFRAI